MADLSGAPVVRARGTRRRRSRRRGPLRRLRRKLRRMRWGRSVMTITVVVVAMVAGTLLALKANERLPETIDTEQFLQQ